MSPRQTQLTSRDRKLIEQLASEFPVVPRPFQVLAEQYDMDEATFIEWVTELVAAGQLKTLRPTLDIEVKEE